MRAGPPQRECSGSVAAPAGRQAIQAGDPPGPTDALARIGQSWEHAMAAVTAELAAYCASLDFATLPPEVQERTRFLVLDLVGNIVRGRHDAESTPALLAAARALGLAAGGSAVLGDSRPLHPGGGRLPERRAGP